MAFNPGGKDKDETANTAETFDTPALKSIERVRVMRAYAEMAKGLSTSKNTVCGPGGNVSFYDEELGRMVTMRSGDVYDVPIDRLLAIESKRKDSNPAFVEPDSQKLGDRWVEIRKLDICFE